MSYFCIAYQKDVDGHRHAIFYDVCKRWRHRLCETSVYLFILPFFFAITDITLSSLYFQFQFLNGHGETSRGQNDTGRNVLGMKHLGEEMVWGRNASEPFQPLSVVLRRCLDRVLPH